jgi:nucleotide-binding universal stress UspA family protein
MSDSLDEGHGQGDGLRVVVGVDGSDLSRKALIRAAIEANAHSAQLDVVHAWNFLDQHGPDFDPHYGEDKARAMVDALVTEVLGDDRPTGTTLVMINDHPAPSMVQAASGAFMVVVGARGLGGFRGLVLGSVSRHVVQHAPCPVLVVR